MKLADKLIELRKEKGWSQEDFAEKLEVSRQAISRWENGTALPDAQNILRISKLFNVSADYLLMDDYDGQTDIPTVETVIEKTAPLVRKKKFPYWQLILSISFIILAVCVIIKIAKDSNEAHPGAALNSVRENEVAPTCTSEGSYDEVIYCTDCNEEILRTTKIVAKLSHTLSSSVRENEIAPTCTSEGSYDEVIYCTDCNAEILRTTKSVAKLSHTLSSSVRENEVAPTCKAEGSYDEVVYCTECDVEISRTAKSVAKLSHTLSSSVKENVVAPTCTKDGSYNEVVYCTKCKGAVLVTRRTTEKLGHRFEDRKCIVCDEDQPSEGLIYMSNGDGTCFVDMGTCTDENIVIPECSPSGETVVQIKSYAFRGNSRVKSIKLPDTIILIGDGAFQDCINLESINLPSKLQRISSYMFEGCKKLKGVTIPSEVYYIGNEAFADCIAFESIVIPANVTKIGQFAFRNFSACEGTVTFEIYEGWHLYDESGNCVDVLYFQDSPFKPVAHLTFINSEYWWKRISYTY